MTTDNYTVNPSYIIYKLLLRMYTEDPFLNFYLKLTFKYIINIRIEFNASPANEHNMKFPL